MDIYEKLQQRLNNKVLADESLSRYTTFRIGGAAQFFFIAQDSAQVVEAVRTARELNLPYCILGNGGNVLVSDEGVVGLVIKIQSPKIEIEGQLVKVEAGVSLARMVLETAKHGLTGLEFVIGIPGSVGGAICGNVGKPEVEKGSIGDWVKTVTIFRGDQIIKSTQEECQFGYRDSLFKHNNDVILEAEFELEKGNEVESQKIISKNLEKKKNSQPLGQPSSGSIFKNSSGKKAWQLIDEVGLRGRQMGGAKISDKHANFIVNTGGATASDVVKLISLIKQQVRDKLGVQLEEEIRYLGF